MMPVFPALTLVSGVAFARWLQGGRSGPVKPVFAAAAIAVLSMGVVQSLAAADFGKRSFGAALGLEGRDAYRGRILTTYHGATKAVNRIVGRRERVLMIGDGRAYGFSPLVLNRDIEDTPCMLELARSAQRPEEIGKQLREMGVKYLLLNYVSSAYIAVHVNQVFHWKAAEVWRYWEYFRRHATIAWAGESADHTNGGFILYRIGATPRPAAGMLPFLPGTEGLMAPGGGDADSGRRRIRDRDLDDMLRSYPPVARFYNAVGDTFVSQKHWGIAYRYYRVAAGARAVDDANWYSYGLAATRSGHADEGAAALERARTACPDKRGAIDELLASYYHARGEALMARRDYRAAGDAFASCLACLRRMAGMADVREAEALVLLRAGLALAVQGRVGEARQAYAEALRVLPRAERTADARNLLRLIGK
jgi:tetratricopeptide (TPR) repeat protein